MTCDIPLEISQRELQLCFRPHFDPRFAREIMGLQSPGSPGSLGKKSHLDVVFAERRREYYKGEGGGFPQVRAVVSLVCPCCPWLSQHQRCSNYALTTLCGLCAGPCEWISLSILPTPIPELQHAPLPLQVLWARKRIPTPPSFAVFHLDSHLSFSRSWECVIIGYWTYNFATCFFHLLSH
jgi:hypothetical protein